MPKTYDSKIYKTPVWHSWCAPPIMILTYPFHSTDLYKMKSNCKADCTVLSNVLEGSFFRVLQNQEKIFSCLYWFCIDLFSYPGFSASEQVEIEHCPVLDISLAENKNGIYCLCSAFHFHPLPRPQFVRTDRATRWEPGKGKQSPCLIWSGTTWWWIRENKLSNIAQNRQKRLSTGKKVNILQ